MAIFTLPEQYKQQSRYWIPPLAAGAASWGAFMIIGQTPLIRASGLALVIIGMALALRPFGAVFAFIGAMALAFCPAFWAQTGGVELLRPPEVIAALAAALIGGIALLIWRRKALWGIGIGVLIFGALFLLFVGTPRSLRLTTLLSAWLLYLMIDGLLAANPRPDSPPTGQLGAQHTWGVLLLITLGVLNDPLFALICPAVFLGLFLTGKRMPVIYWVLLVGISIWGFYGIFSLYADSAWWGVNVNLAEANGVQVPFLLSGGWREPSRWIYLIELVIYQFTAVGLVLGVIGLARLSRWYPPVGVVTMIAYGTYALFGLAYFGADASVLLMPMLMIQVVWMTYAVYAFNQWITRFSPSNAAVLRWLAPGMFALLPLILFTRISGLL